jgi:hypothetical protein
VQRGLDEAFTDLVCAQNEAPERLLLVPAPDRAALAVKLGWRSKSWPGSCRRGGADRRGSAADIVA